MDDVCMYIIAHCEIHFRTDWKDTLVVKSADCPDKSPESNLQHTHDSSQACVTIVPRNLILSPDLHQHQTCPWCTCIRAGKTNIFKMFQ